MDGADIKRLMDSLPGAELRETHISWVILAGERAFKIKKPVKFSFLDYSDMEKRRISCMDELRLDRRLAPDIYLDVVGIVPDAKKKGFSLVRLWEMAGAEHPVEYAVEMVRLDEERMMDKLLERNEVPRKRVEELGRIIADFHSRIDKMDPKDGFNSPKMIWEHISDLGTHKKAIEKACGKDFGAKVDFVLERSKKFIDKNKALLASRMENGFVRDCHGDLHSGNIFIDHKIWIIDCIEFNKDFRCVDVASEVAFMVMDLDAHSKEDLGIAFVNEYQAHTQDTQLGTLLPFYKCYRANVRAKVAAIGFEATGSKESVEKIRKYLLLAERYAGML